MKEKKTVTLYGVIITLTVLTLGLWLVTADMKERIDDLEGQMDLIYEIVNSSHDQY